jgi:hypothetical protein
VHRYSDQNAALDIRVPSARVWPANLMLSAVNIAVLAVNRLHDIESEPGGLCLTVEPEQFR